MVIMPEILVFNVGVSVTVVRFNDPNRMFAMDHVARLLHYLEDLHVCIYNGGAAILINGSFLNKEKTNALVADVLGVDISDLEFRSATEEELPEFQRLLDFP